MMIENLHSMTKLSGWLRYCATLPQLPALTVMVQTQNRIPSNFKVLSFLDMIEYFCECNDLCSPKEYLEHYGKPLEIVLDSGNKLA